LGLAVFAITPPIDKRRCISHDGLIDYDESIRRSIVSRVQLALNVDDLDAAVAFYSKLFDTDPAKVRPGYANFAIIEPPLKLVLIEKPGEGGTLNHLGVEVKAPEDVSAATVRLTAHGLATATEDDVACCYARQDKVWVDGPSGETWEIYTVLEDVEMPAGQLRTVNPATGAVCCAAATTDGALVADAGAHCC
jgi:catechol 2,3-dioxygenase-like lactoylglutathione lyase family enzyme